MHVQVCGAQTLKRTYPDMPLKCSLTQTQTDTSLQRAVRACMYLCACIMRYLRRHALVSLPAHKPDVSLPVGHPRIPHCCLFLHMPEPYRCCCLHHRSTSSAIWFAHRQLRLRRQLRPQALILRPTSFEIGTPLRLME